MSFFFSVVLLIPEKDIESLSFFLFSSRFYFQKIRKLKKYGTPFLVLDFCLKGVLFWRFFFRVRNLKTKFQRSLGEKIEKKNRRKGFGFVFFFWFWLFFIFLFVWGLAEIYKKYIYSVLFSSLFDFKNRKKRSRFFFWICVWNGSRLIEPSLVSRSQFGYTPTSSLGILAQKVCTRWFLISLFKRF